MTNVLHNNHDTINVYDICAWFADMGYCHTTDSAFISPDECNRCFAIV